LRVLIKDLSPGTLYALQLRSKDEMETSDWSPVYNLTTTSDVYAPKTPTGTTWAVQGTAFLATWNEVTLSTDESDAHDLAYYLVKLVNAATTVYYKVRTNRFDLSFEMNKAAFGTPKATVEFSVASVDLTGNTSAFSTPISATNPAPSQPANFLATGVQDAIILKWDAVSADDLKHYKVHMSTVSGAFTPDASNLIWTGLATGFTLPTTTTGTDHFFKLAAVDVFDTASTYASDDAQPVPSTAVDTTAPSTPTGFSVTGAMDSADASRANFTATWTAVAASDLQGYKIRFRPGSGPYQFVDVASDATTTIIPDLEVGITYDFQIMAYDFSANESAWSSVDSESVTNAAPSKPSDPTLVGSIQSFAVSHDMQKDAGGPLESDVTALQVYAGDTNVWATASPVLLETIAVSQGSSVAVSAKIPLAIADGAAAKWIYIKAVDSEGLTSPESDAVSVTVDSITGTYIDDATITSAKIQNLEANKIVAGSGIINDLLIKSKLTVDTGGKIESALYASSAGVSGFYLDDDELIIKSGAIEAAALKIQSSANIMPPQYAGFEFTPAYYVVRAVGGAADASAVISVDGAAITGLAITAGATSFKYETQGLRIVQTSGTTRTIYMGNSTSTRNIETEEGKSYIVSAWVKHNGGSAANFTLGLSGDASYTQSGTTSIPNGSTYTRMSFVATIGAGANKTLLRFEIPSTALTWDIDGIMVEEKISGATTPSLWKPPGATSIDGGIIRTGEIRSTTEITVNSVQQPNWSINTQGKAQFGDALVRGQLIVGGAAGADGTDSKIQSHNYVAGSTGWIVRSDGFAEFGNVTSRGALKAGTVPGIWIMERTHPDFPTELFADTDIKSAIINWMSATEYTYSASAADTVSGNYWTERGTVRSGNREVADTLTQTAANLSYYSTDYTAFHNGVETYTSGSLLGVNNGSQFYCNVPVELTNHIEFGRLAGNAILFARVDGTDTIDRYAINIDGTHEWGPGGASGRDTNLYRHAANVLRTDDTFRAAAITNDDDTGDVSVTAGTGWATTGGYITVRRWGKFVFCRWQIIRTGANLAANVDSTLFALDTQYRPAGEVLVASEGNYSVGNNGLTKFETGGNVIIDAHEGINTNQRTAGSAMWMVA
jgi:hypothetical protein